MRKSLLTLIGAATIAIAPVTAGAVTYDFTDSLSYGPADLTDTQSVGGSSVSATLSSNGTLSFTTFDGDSSVASLAFIYDGIGVGDDEITNPDQQIIVTFSETVAVTGFHFLDLFFVQGGGDSEIALVYLNDILVYSFMASEVFQTQGGYLFASIAPLFADQLVFRAGTGNDGVGSPDYALAAIDVTTTVPLPAALPLFGTGLGILGFLGWRRRRQAQAV